MGAQSSTTRNAGGKWAFEPKNKAKCEKVKIEILAFEVSSIMSKCVQLWKSLSEREVRRLRTEIIRSEGVLNFVSKNESALLNLACFEKLQDLTWIALAVARLGKRCHEPALAGFEHIYTDILKQNIDVSELKFSANEMGSKVRKMERHISITSNLYQEIEVLSELEQALQKLHEEGDPVQKDSLLALEQKIAWQQQEIKYLKEISLWSRTFDKVIGLLACSVCTIYGRIVTSFESPVLCWPQVLPILKEVETLGSHLHMNCEMGELQKLSSSCVSEAVKLSNLNVSEVAKLSSKSTNGSVKLGNFENNGLVHSKEINLTPGINFPAASYSNGSTHGSSHRSDERLANGNPDSFIPLSFCCSPGRQFSNCKGPTLSMDASSDSSPSDAPIEDFCNSKDCSDSLLPGSRPVWQTFVNQNGVTSKLIYDLKNRLQNAPPSTLGGTGLALHYANVIILVEKMVKYPHLISQEARDDLYQMLPKNIRVALRGRLRCCIRGSCFMGYNGDNLLVWKEPLEKFLGLLAPLAHNMIRWQSEHNFEQQQVVNRTNVLLLQTLYFADHAKAEAALTELLVCLNHLWRYDRDLQVNSLMEYSSNKDLDEYLEWQL